MRKFIRYILPLALLGMLSSGCEDYLNINDDPNRVTEVDLASLLPSTQLALANSHYSITTSTGRVTQHISSYFGYIDEGTLRIGGAWSTLYLRVLENARIMAEQAQESGSPHYEGVAKTIQAYGLLLLSDQWEDVPWTEAFKGSENLTPVFDSQESLYTTASQLLDEAIPLLGAEESIFSPGGDDLIYGGDLSLWAKAAYGIQARLAIHLVNKGGSYAQDAIDAAARSFASPEEDFQFIYNSVIRNPWHTNVALANNTGNFSFAQGAYFVNQLNGSIYPDVDPRLNILATLDEGATTYIGIESFNTEAPSNTVNFRVDTWHSRELAPMEMVTYAEMKFIEAEAYLALNQPDAAYTAYLAGIEADMGKRGVGAADITAYLGAPSVAVGAGSLSLEEVMRQKYIALFLNPEAWVDMRRHNYSTEVYKGFITPDPVMWGGPAQRALYPLDELNRNGAEVEKVSKPFGQPMWRDQ